MNIKHYLGTELYWWRETGTFHTIITLFAGVYDVSETMQYAVVLFDSSGKYIAEWEYTSNSREPVFIDSRDHTRFDVQDGVLAVFVGTIDNPSSYLLENYERLYGCIDWFSDKGDICTLHSDQSFRPGMQGQEISIELTEIIVDVGNDIASYLVFINGTTEQPDGAISLTIQNYKGEELSSVYNRKMAPFSLHKLYLDELFPSIEGFSQGRRIAIKGDVNFKTGLFCRPYVVSESAYMHAYHGGSRYVHMNTLLQLLLQNSKDMPGNPFFVIHNANISTRLNLFNSHGDSTDDLWVDLRIFDKKGGLVVSQEKAIFISRGKYTVVDVKDLIPGACDGFIGHFSLNYHRDPGKLITGVQQCLVEYHTDNSVSRVMLWSDLWNSDERQVLNIQYKSFQRAWITGDRKTYFAVVNSSIHLDYKLSAEYVVRVIGENKKVMTYTGCVGPQATDYFCLEDLDPGIAEHFNGQTVVLVQIETHRDLAIVQLTFCESHGTCAAEHMLAMQTMQNSNIHYCTGR
jgi:hypothetical protein